jgi:hypothetical protein
MAYPKNIDADHAPGHVVSARAFDLLTTVVVGVWHAVSLATVVFTPLRSGRWSGRLRRPRHATPGRVAVWCSRGSRCYSPKTRKLSPVR